MIRHPLSRGDEFGTVFRWNGHLLRVVKINAQESFLEFWKSGLWQDLVARGWVPETRMSEFKAQSGGLVLEHTEVSSITYPSEWTYSMLHAAAEHTLRVANLATEYGYELKDAHGYNIVFDGGRPLFVDIGSFIVRPTGSIGWIADQEFAAFFLYPLSIWKTHGAFLARRMILGGEVIDTYLALRVKTPLLCLLPRVTSVLCARAIRGYSLAQQVSRAKLLEKCGKIVGCTIDWMRRGKVWPFRTARIPQLEGMLRATRLGRQESSWRNYHSVYRETGQTERIRAIVNLVDELRSRSIMDIGCNQGEFSLRFSNLPTVERVIAVDADHGALEFLFGRLQRKCAKVVPAYCDIMAPLSPPLGSPQSERWRVDTVVALAISHHLILTQKYSVDAILQRFAAFGRNYLLVEFMPLGLWDGKSAPAVPEWYTREWFRDAFLRHCFDVREVDLEANRVLFWGRIKG